MKISLEQQQHSEEVMKSIITKSWDDASFKQSLIKSPIETIQAFTGKKLNLPEGVKLVVNDQTDPSFVHINLPAKPNLDNLELTDEQLEMVAGGELAVAAGIAIGLAIVALYYQTHD